MIWWLWKRLSSSCNDVVSGSALSRFSETEIDSMLRKRILTELPKIGTWPVCDRCECGLDARPIREIADGYLACCPLDRSEDVVLNESDLCEFAIDEDSLCATIATDSGMSGGAARVMDGAWKIGASPGGRTIVLCRNVSILDAPGAILALKNVTGPSPITLIVDEFDAALSLRLSEANIDLHRLEDCLSGSDPAEQHLVLEGLAPASRSPRLIVSSANQGAMFDGRQVSLTVQTFSLLLMLAERAQQRNQVLTSQSIEAKTQRSPSDVVRDLRQRFESLGMTSEETKALIATVRSRGYRLALDTDEIVIERTEATP